MAQRAARRPLRTRHRRVTTKGIIGRGWKGAAGDSERVPKRRAGGGRSSTEYSLGAILDTVDARRPLACFFAVRQAAVPGAPVHLPPSPSHCLDRPQ